MSEALISVCIPVYNGEEFIKDAIDSVLNQTHTNFEIIIVDNQSTDATLQFVKQYSDSRIRVFQNNSNIGLIPNWNKALEYTKGKYIKILPADDILLPDCLRLQAMVLENDNAKKIALVCGRRNIIDKNGKTIFTRGFSSKAKIIPGPVAINKVIRSGGNIIGEGGAVMFRKEILALTGNFNSDIFYVLDLDLWFKMLLHGHLAVIPETISGFRVSGNSSSVKIVKKQKEDYFAFIKKIYGQKEYQLSRTSYNLGLCFTFILTEIKKLIYRFVV